MTKKITVIGSGFTGTTTAFMLAMKGLGDIVLLDTPSKENPTKGKALDIMEASPLIHSSVQITGTSNYKSTADSDVVIITAGIARKPGMSRDELCDINAEIITNVVHQVVRYSPDCTLIILSNPVDIMTYIALKASRFTRNRVIGQSGVLDTARFRYFVADELKVSSEDVTGFVLGVHGDDMVPLVRYCSVHGIPIQQLLSEEKIKKIIERTRHAGAEIVNLLGDGSAYYAPAAALTAIVESILLDQHRVMPCVVHLEGELGYKDLVLSVPAVIGKNGVEKILSIELLPDERELIDRSVASVRCGINSILERKIQLIS
ncbi:malate dehydrogenase (NAD) [Desulfitobacterium dichloroeliminans LMG P-21439]|uniref:Malate dehydrogenase n=1 Tax=Desulfitobacterium dichloroeliminans (strain LMG P-21439 / DCA1) TaxID=871963 RepID=L0F5Z0_DESDL|nr:malate dehydrogenase [Desulfitobacterium dichloroeliminans]AGA68046.1 malate dehydrogenase (NAD) [Desulfitobacterium dichloroeliminans LMG P-21439]